MSEHKHPASIDTFDIASALTFSVGQNMEQEMERTSTVPLLYLNRRQTEKAMLSLVCAGNLHLLEAHISENLHRYGSGPIGTMSREFINQQRYFCVILITMISRAVIDAGVPEQIAFSLSDTLILQADQMRRPEQLLELAVDSMRVYCQAVHNYRMKSISAPVKKCCEYMMLKLHANITLQEISQICHLSPNYISDLFRKELGVSALQYFHQLKMQYAKHLVLHSDWSIAKISALLSYPSQSNFTERFKKTYGATPMQYRKIHT